VAAREIETNTVDRHDDLEGRQAPRLFAATVPLKSDLRVIAARIPHAQFVLIILATDIPPIFISHVTAVLESGIRGIEYFDADAEIARVRKEAVPAAYRTQRAEFVGRTEAGISMSFGIAGLSEPATVVPAVQCANLSRSMFALMHLGLELKDLHNLASKPFSAVTERCRRTLRTWISLMMQVKRPISAEERPPPRFCGRSSQRRLCALRKPMAVWLFRGAHFLCCRSQPRARGRLSVGRPHCCIFQEV
jgi:hypothetical protein